MPNNFIQSNLLSRIPKNILLIIVGICFCCSLLICGQEARPLAIIVLTLSLSFCGYKFYSDYVLIVSNDRVVVEERTREPSDLKFEIGNYEERKNSIAKTGSNRIESSEFSAGDHSWRMVMYPNGNRRENVDGYVSFYLRLVNTLTGSGGSVVASFKFFLLDKQRGTYVTISGGTINKDGRQREFNDANLEWGIPQAVRIATLQDKRSGLLTNNSCTIGAEVYVKNNITRTTARLCLVSITTRRTTTWEVHLAPDARVRSHSFSVANRIWQLRLYPNGHQAGEGTHLSLYLCLEDPANLTGGRKLYVQFTLSIRDQIHGTDHAQNSGFWFDLNNNHNGFDKFLQLTELNNSNRGYNNEGTLFIEANLNTMFVQYIN